MRGVEIAGQSLIFYGLGNFLHQGTADITNKGVCRDYGLMARVHLKKAADGKLKLRAVEAIPVADTHFRPRPLTGEDGAARIHALNYLDSDLGGARGDLPSPRSPTAPGSTVSPAPPMTVAKSARCARATGRRRRSPTTS